MAPESDMTAAADHPTRAKAGTSKASAAQRRALFKAAYITNGHNATRAAITAGYSPKTAHAAGGRLLKDVRVAGDLAKAAQETADAAGLTAERIIEETRRLSVSNAARLFRPDGTLKDIAEMDEATQAAISTIEFDPKTGKVTRVKLWDKGAALEKSFRHLGLYEKDNAQQQESLVLRIEAARPVNRR